MDDVLQRYVCVTIVFADIQVYHQHSLIMAFYFLLITSHNWQNASIISHI